MIKKFTTLLVVAFATFSISLAQPTITNNFNPVLGSNVVFAIGDTNNVSEGAAGANITWDFSTLQQVGNNTSYTHIAPSATPYASQFPAATLAYQTVSGQGNTGYIYYKISSSVFENVGVGTPTLQMYYTNPQTILEYPTTFNSSFTDAFSGSGTNSQNITTYRTGTVTSNADGWGTLILPQGTFNNVLRVRLEQNVSDSIHFMGNDIINTSKVVTYNFYRDDIKQQLLGISYTFAKDFFGDDIIIKSVLYYPDALNSISETSKNKLLTVYPNPATSNITIQWGDAGMQTSKVVVKDMLGKQVAAQNTNIDGTSATFDVSSLSNGVYFVSLENNNNTIASQKLIITK